MDATAYRVVHAEGDGLPSLIVDRFGDFAVAQLLSEANAFDWLRAEADCGARYDVIVLDSPAFAKDKRSLQRALAGYKAGRRWATAGSGSTPARHRNRRSPCSEWEPPTEGRPRAR